MWDSTTVRITPMRLLYPGRFAVGAFGKIASLKGHGFNRAVKTRTKSGFSRGGMVSFLSAGCPTSARGWQMWDSTTVGITAMRLLYQGTLCDRTLAAPLN
jgi:hypothetical protein